MDAVEADEAPRVGPTTPNSIDPRWLRSIRPTRASRPSDASVDPTDARNSSTRRAHAPMMCKV
jgi:hypothetical protein